MRDKRGRETEINRERDRESRKIKLLETARFKSLNFEVNNSTLSKHFVVSLDIGLEPQSRKNLLCDRAAT